MFSDLHHAIKIYKELNTNFGIPCIVHSTNYDGFLNILNSKKVAIDSERNTDQELRIGIFDKLLKIYNCTFWSCGFQFNSWFDLEYAIIFDLDLLDLKFTVYKNHIINQSIKITKDYFLK